MCHYGVSHSNVVAKLVCTNSFHPNRAFHFKLSANVLMFQFYLFTINLLSKGYVHNATDKIQTKNQYVSLFPEGD